jgi:hypothetical protein
MYDYRISGVDDTVTLTLVRRSASTKRLRDFQRSKVYSWERAVFGRPTEKLTLEQCAELAKKLCGFKVTVKDGRGRRKACAYYETRTIALPKWARCEWVVIHECAQPAHGPGTRLPRRPLHEELHQAARPVLCLCTLA